MVSLHMVGRWLLFTIISIGLMLGLSARTKANVMPVVLKPIPEPQKPVVTAWVNRANNTYVMGETIFFTVQVKHQDAYITIENARARAIFPKSHQHAPLVKAGEKVVIACGAAAPSKTVVFTVVATARTSQGNQRDTYAKSFKVVKPDVSLQPERTHWSCTVKG